MCICLGLWGRPYLPGWVPGLTWASSALLGVHSRGLSRARQRGKAPWNPDGGPPSDSLLAARTWGVGGAGGGAEFDIKTYCESWRGGFCTKHSPSPAHHLQGSGCPNRAGQQASQPQAEHMHPVSPAFCLSILAEAKARPAPPPLLPYKRLKTPTSFLLKKEKTAAESKTHLRSKV